jgi:hypothetical protein
VTGTGEGGEAWGLGLGRVGPVGLPPWKTMLTVDGGGSSSESRTRGIVTTSSTATTACATTETKTARRDKRPGVAGRGGRKVAASVKRRGIRSR